MKRAAGAPLPRLAGAEGPATSRRAALYRRVRGAIVEGSLAPGARLPSTRALAAELGLSRTTAEEAFQQLVAEGFLERRVGDGTYVSAALPVRPAAPAAPAPGVVLSARGRRVAETPLHEDTRRVRAFRGGQPDVLAFPLGAWRRLLSHRLGRRGARLLDYGEAQGYRPLREAIAAHAAASRGVRCGPGQVIVLSSSQQAHDLAARLLVDPGDQVWLEDPCYQGALGAMRGAGAAVVPVPVDEAGMDVAAGRAAAPRARLAVVTPSHQYPLGVTLSLERRLALLDWAAAAGALVLEDDYDSEYRYEGRPIAAIQGLDRAGRVLYVGTFTKMLYPSLRLAYLIVPDALVDAFVAARRLVDGHPPVVMQAVTADFMEGGHLVAHLRAMRQLYGERRAVLLEALRREAGGAGRLGPADAGLHVTLHLEGVPDAEVRARGLALGVDLSTLSGQAIRPGSANGLILGDAALTPAAIREGARALAQALAGGRRGAGRRPRA